MRRQHHHPGIQHERFITDEPDETEEAESAPSAFEVPVQPREQEALVWLLAHGTLLPPGSAQKKAV
jgi:hypothetical protein